MTATVDPASRAAYAEAIARLGLCVTFQRVNGAPPNATLLPTGGAAVSALVRNALADSTEAAATGYSAGQIGAIGQADREVLVMAADLLTAGFPLPLLSGDQVVLAAEDGGETLSIVRVDPAKRKIAGVITCTAVGIS